MKTASNAQVRRHNERVVRQVLLERREATRQQLAQKTGLSAMTVGTLLAAMQERRVRIPEQVSVTGLDDIPYARISSPSLTSVTNDSVAFAREGVRMLFERIDGIVTGKARDVAVRHELIVRSSVSVPREAL